MAALADKLDGLRSKDIGSRKIGWHITIHAGEKRFSTRTEVSGINRI